LFVVVKKIERKQTFNIMGFLIPISLVGRITTPSLFKNYYENTSLIYEMFIDCANYF